MIFLLCLLLAEPAPPRKSPEQLQAELRRAPRNSQIATDLGYAYAKLGQTKEAEKYYRLALELKPSRFYAYGNLADLLVSAPDRFERADEIVKLLERGLAAVPAWSRANVVIHIADFERASGRTAQARARLAALMHLSADQRRRVRDLQDRIADEERAQALRDWPEPQWTAAQEKALEQAGSLLQTDPRGALAAAEALSTELPAWRAPRRARARALESLGRADDEARELRVLTQLAPSDAQAWRRLGEILAQQGGFVETDRADEALRQALSLEPSWIELWLLRARVALRQGRAQDALKELQRYALSGGQDAEAARLEALARAQPERSQAPSALPASREPSAQARALVAQASAPDITPAAARELLTQALKDSPADIEAAAALVALGGAVPDTTVQALQNDGAGLLELATQTLRAGASRPEIAPWIDRAAQLGAAEALLFRARLATDSKSALQDLLAYAASRDPQHLDEARALRMQLEAPREDLTGLLARLRLNEDRPDAALAALGGKCDQSASQSQLLALGAVHEYAGELAAAVTCYRAASPAPEALRKLSRLGSRVPLPQAAAELKLAEQQGLPAASWALARIDLEAGREAQALPRLSRFLEQASPGDPGLEQARLARARILRKAREAAQDRLRKQAAVALLAAALLIAVLAFFWSGSTVSAALRRAPRFFPAVARAVGEVRHDVLKHRASALSMVAEPGANREEIARALLSPEPASQAVLRQYQELRKAARAQGVRLRRAWREPVFGPLLRDLVQAEKQVTKGSLAELRELDLRLRERHTARLASLLKLGPRTRVDAGAVSGWIRDVEAEARRGGAPWRPPSILLQNMQVDFPVERTALQAIFANLLRNAQAAAAGGEIIVRLGEERDAAGRNLTVLLVGDCAEGGVTLASIEQRESGRGLALVRDLTREWQGHLVVRGEELPWKKAVGACFPALPA